MSEFVKALLESDNFWCVLVGTLLVVAFLFWILSPFKLYTIADTLGRIEKLLKAQQKDGRP